MQQKKKSLEKIELFNNFYNDQITNVFYVQSREIYSFFFFSLRIKINIYLYLRCIHITHNYYWKRYNDFWRLQILLIFKLVTVRRCEQPRFQLHCCKNVVKQTEWVLSLFKFYKIQRNTNGNVFIFKTFDFLYFGHC